MAKIKEMPGLKIISGFKGTLDYYYHDGQACVRRWPRSPGHRRSPGVQAQWLAFTQSAQLWNTLSPEVRATYDRLAAGTGLSGRDFFTRAYLKGLYRYPPP